MTKIIASGVSLLGEDDDDAGTQLATALKICQFGMTWGWTRADIHMKLVEVPVCFRLYHTSSSHLTLAYPGVRFNSGGLRRRQLSEECG